MKKKILNSSFLILAMTTFLLLNDFLFHLYNADFYFRLSSKNILPALGYSLLSFLIANKKWRNLAISLFFIASMFQFFYFQYFGQYIQPIAFLQLFNNFYDVYDSFIPALVSFIYPFVTSIIFLGISLFLSNKFSKKIYTFKYSSQLINLSLIIMLIQTFVYLSGVGADGKLKHWQARALYPNKKELSTFNVHKSINYFLVGIIPKKVIGSTLDFPVLAKPQKALSENNNIVFVLGESLRYDRLSLFGYSQKTTPLLDSLANIGKIAHKVVYSGGTMTKTSGATIFNRLQYPGMEQVLAKNNNLFKLAKENGYQTAFISSQSGGSMSILESLMGRKNIDFYLHRSNFDENRADYTRCDEDILPYLKEIDLNQKNFIVLQQRGSHSPYNKYTKEFDTFDNDYDKTVAYTDYFLTKVYDYLEKNSKIPTYFIFASDHGELLGERGKNGHGWFEREVYLVPIITASLNTDNKIDIDKIESHFELSNYLVELLGYKVDHQRKTDRTIYVNGSDLDGLAGYMKVKMSGDSVVAKEIIK